MRTVLVEWLRVAEVWVGANFLFGHDRAGNFTLLRTLGGRYGFKAEKIDPVRYKDFVVSSTRIRRLIAEGRVDEAGALLGHQYYIDGTVVRGDGRGRTIGFPTANLCTDNELLPPHGVYATMATIGGIVRPSVTNIGVRPTVDSSGRVWTETHIFDFDRDLYGATLRLGFVQRLRDERAFESVDQLRAQIAADCSRARVLFGAFHCRIAPRARSRIPVRAASVRGRPVRRDAARADDARPRLRGMPGGRDRRAQRPVARRPGGRRNRGRCARGAVPCTRRRDRNHRLGGRPPHLSRVAPSALT